MAPFAYLSVLTSIVLALGTTRVLTGLGRLLQARGSVRLYWVHLLWALNLFLYLVLNWWILFRWRDQQQWTFFLFLFVLLSPTVAFLMSVLLFPDLIEASADLRLHYYANHRWYFTLAALLPVIDAFDTLLKGWDHFAAQGTLYPVTLLAIFGFSVAAAATRKPWFHAAFAVFFLVYILAFISINLRLLN